ncbi:hypothetical protein BDR04DRAFT_1097010 [Suillus decipiens]|nr:hypothetical protein BDR04DRAFT_1097010 [Suillus decipiens]
MSYPYYRTTLDGWGSNQLQFGRPPPVQFQPQPSWGGHDYFRAHAPQMDPAIFNQVYSRILSGHMTSVGVGINEARIWHRRGYGGLCEIDALTPQEIGYASAYEAYRVWIHNSTLYEPLGAEIEHQREAFIGLAIAEALRMYMISCPADARGCMPACEAAAATASHIFDENLSGRAGGGIGVGTGHDTGMDVSTYGSGFGSPGMAGSGMAGEIDPHAIDYEAPYFRQRIGRHRGLSMPAPYDATGAYGPRAGTVMRVNGGSPYLGTVPGIGMEANPGIYGGGSPLGGRNGMEITGMHESAYPAYSARSPVYGGASQVHVPPIYGASSPYTGTRTPNITTVSAHPGTTTIIHLPRRRHRSSSRHSEHHSRRARSAEPSMITYTNANTMGSPTFNSVRGAASGAARVVGSAVGGIAGGAAGFVGGAVGGLARGAVGGFRSGAMEGTSIGTYGPSGGSMGGFYGNPNKGYSYPGGHRSMYRY